MLKVNINQLNYFYGGTALKNINFSCSLNHEIISIVGKNEAGKTSLIRAIVGLETISDGYIKVDDFDINKAICNENFQVLFNGNDLFRYKSVYFNLSYILNLRKVPKNEIRNRVIEALNGSGILYLMNSPIYKLTFFEKIKVQLTRTLLRDSKFVLIDNIFSKLIDDERKEAFIFLKSLINKSTRSFIYTTDSPEEAISLGGEILVLRYGNLEQIGNYLEIVNNPKNLFVDQLFHRYRNFIKKEDIPLSLYNKYFKSLSRDNYIASYMLSESGEGSDLLAKTIDHLYLSDIYLIRTDLGYLLSNILKPEYAVEITKDVRYYSENSEIRLT